MATVKMRKGELTVNINDSPESISHAMSMGYALVDGTLKVAGQEEKEEQELETGGQAGDNIMLQADSPAGQNESHNGNRKGGRKRADETGGFKADGNNK